ncbi:hypothetical protein BKA63DRAFT_594206 [Paraphoma chrysanthemicola]|nr:hypothetical protein BKA63DRAFT_594206 [Paraphoma chrysanthemicola]
MPTLKDLNCSIELSESQRTLQEFGTTYGDGFVETFVSVPSKPQSFSIHLTSDRFIAPGISMYVFVDGVYQCNRNRQDLKLRKDSDNRSIVDFKVRQKEEKQKDGSMIAREWKFEKLNTTTADDAPEVCSANVLDNIGCIEVLVLRCAGPRTAKTVSTMNMDGACDLYSHYLGMDGQKDGRSMYDDRAPALSSQVSHRPPPPLPYRSPYAETLHSGHSPPFLDGKSPFESSKYHRAHSKYSEPVSPGARPTSTIPSSAFHYGSGPVPTGPMHGSERSFCHTRPASAAVANAPDVDAAWLNEILTKAVKKGVEEVRRNEAGMNGHIAQQVSQPAPQQHPHHGQSGEGGDRKHVWAGSPGDWSQQPSHLRTKSRVGWEKTSKWDSQSLSESWGAQEETQSDTWDMDETWGTEKPSERRGSRWGKSKASTTCSRRRSRPKSPATARTHARPRSSTRYSNKSQSKPGARAKSSGWYDVPTSSSEDREDWVKVRSMSDSSSSQEDSEVTARSRWPRSKLHNSRERSKSRHRSHQTRSAHKSDRVSSRHLRGGADVKASSTLKRHAPSIGMTATPTVMNAPAPVHQSASLPTAGFLPAPLPSHVPPPPDWATAVADGLRRHNLATKTNPPSPFSMAGTESRHDAVRSDSSTTWGPAKKSKHNKAVSSRSTSWGERAADQEKRSKMARDGRSEWGNDNKAGWSNPDNVPGGWGGNQDSWVADDISKKEKEDNVWPRDQTSKETDNAWATLGDIWAEESAKTNDMLAVGWNDTAWPSTPDALKPTKDPSRSVRQTSKSLSRYRRPSNTPSTAAKPHWKFPPSPSTSPLTPTTPKNLLPPEPRLTVPASAASSSGLEHHVRAGPGSLYGHAIARPTYLDTLESPYAVFRFKYRSRNVLKNMFGDAVPATGHLSTRIPSAQAVREKEKFNQLDKDELVEKMVQLQAKLGTRDKSTESVARGLTEEWVREQSREASEKARSSRSESARKEKKKSEKAKKEKNDGKNAWDQDGGWANTTW